VQLRIVQLHIVLIAGKTSRNGPWPPTYRRYVWPWMDSSTRYTLWRNKCYLV